MAHARIEAGGFEGRYFFYYDGTAPPAARWGG